MKVFEGKTFAEVYKKSLEDLMYNAEYETSPRGMKIKENTNVALVVQNPRSCLYENERRSSQFKYIAAELLFYFGGRNDLKFIEKYAKFWQQIATERGTVNSAYGHLLFSEKNEFNITQWNWALDSLKKDKNTRQAIVLFNKPKYQYFDNKDVICTLNGNFMIRDNKLNFTVEMRSNDVVLGTATDIAFFCMLQEQMYKHLKPIYPELELGTYTHIALSYHIYERHFDLVDGMIKSDFKAIEYPKIEEDLINSLGNPTPELIAITDFAENGSNYSTEDPLFNWIYDKLS